MTPTDEQLVAYLDGALPETEAAAIALALSSDPDVAARAEALALDTDALRAGMDALLASAPTLDIPQAGATEAEAVAPTATTANRPWAPRWTQIAACLAVFAIGLVAGRWVLPDTQQAGWHMAVAQYQVLYTGATVTSVPQTDEQRAAGLATVAKALDLDLSADRIAVPGLTFQRAQLLEWQGQPLAQIVYLDGEGRPIAFCLRRGGTERAVHADELAGMQAVTWARGGLDFIVIGPVNAETLTLAANTLAPRLPG